MEIVTFQINKAFHRIGSRRDATPFLCVEVRTNFCVCQYRMALILSMLMQRMNDMSIENCHKDAVAAVAAVTGISPEEITGRCKARHLVDARWMVAMLMWKEGYYPRQIAGQMGVSVRWIQKIVECFQDRIRYSHDDSLRRNWEESAKILRTC